MVTVQIGDVGTAFEVSVTNQDGSAFDLATATALHVAFRKPDGASASRAATSPSAGVVRYVTVAGDLDQPGRWKVQAHVVTTAGDWHTSVGVFKVKPNLE
jgi:hypothetical protein